MRLNMEQIGGCTVCAGAGKGREVMIGLLSATPRSSNTQQPIFLDFGGVEIATASFLREAVLGYRNILREQGSPFYAVVANANDAIQEELEELAHSKGEVLLACTLDASGTVAASKTLGRLEPKQQMVFDLIHERGESDASELHRDFGEAEGIKQTAWNNRLSALAASGLLVEVNRGRSKRYRPILVGA